MITIDVTPHLATERSALIEVLQGLSLEDWGSTTECPDWTVQDIALHVLGDDLSLLSRQRDEATNSLILFAQDHPGHTVAELLDGFNEQWVQAARFLSPAMLVEMLSQTGGWTEDYYESVDLTSSGEPVGFFGATGKSSPLWQAIAREYAERWIHQSQIRRALYLAPTDSMIAAPAIDAVVLGLLARNPDLDGFLIGDASWGSVDGVKLSLDPNMAVDVLSRALPLAATVASLDGDTRLVEAIAAQTCRDRNASRMASGS